MNKISQTVQQAERSLAKAETEIYPYRYATDVGEVMPSAKERDPTLNIPEVPLSTKPINLTY